MTLREHYNSLKKIQNPANQFILILADKTGRKASTVRQWISGAQIPDYETKLIISNEVGIPPEELFP